MRRATAERKRPAPEFDLVHEALDRMPPDQREVLTLSAWDDLDNREIAVVLGITPAAVAVRLHRARRRLARELGQLGLTAAGESVQSGAGERTPGRVQEKAPEAEKEVRS